MKRKIIGVTVGTPLSPKSIKEKLKDDINGANPDKIIFPDGLKTTYAIGKVKLENGMGTLVEPGGTLADFFNVFIDEKNPVTKLPAVTLTFSQAQAYEVGTKLTPTFSASLNPGSYSYDPSTGVTATGWLVKDSRGNEVEADHGDFPELKVDDNTNFKITAKATYSDGIVPHTNTGKSYPAGQIKTDTTDEVESGAITGFRKTFYGTREVKDTLDSGKIRGLAGKSTKALKDGDSFKVTVPVGAMRVIIAYPADKLRDLTEVKDDGTGFPITESFNKTTVKVAGVVDGSDEIDYKVYTMDFAEPNDTANSYTAKI